MKTALLLSALGVAEAFLGSSGVAFLRRGRPMPRRAWDPARPPVAAPPSAPLGLRAPLCAETVETARPRPACPRVESMATATCVVATRHADDVASGVMADALRRRAEWVKLDYAQGDLYQCSKSPHVFLWVSVAHV